MQIPFLILNLLNFFIIQLMYKFDILCTFCEVFYFKIKTYILKLTTVNITD